MKQCKKKRISLVERILFIAAIVMLAAAIVIVVCGTNRSDISADEKAVREMNSALESYIDANGTPKGATEVRTALRSVGVDPDCAPVAAGYAYYWNGKQVVLVCAKEAKATVAADWVLLGGNEFGNAIAAYTTERITAAISASQNTTPSFVTLQESFTISEKFNLTETTDIEGETRTAVFVIEEGESLILDLNGKTLENEVADYLFQITNGGELTVKNGTLKGHRAIDCSGGTVTLDNVTVISDDVCAIHTVGLYDMTIADCSISTTGNYAVSSDIGDNTYHGGRLSIENSKISALWSGIYIPTYSEVRIDGSTICGSFFGAYFRGCNATISNCTITNNGEVGSDTWRKCGGIFADIVFASGDGKDGAYADTATYTCSNVKAETIVVHEPGTGKVTLNGIEPTRTSNSWMGIRDEA